MECVHWWCPQPSVDILYVFFPLRGTFSLQIADGGSIRLFSIPPVISARKITITWLWKVRAHMNLYWILHYVHSEVLVPGSAFTLGNFNTALAPKLWPWNISSLGEAPPFAIFSKWRWDMLGFAVAPVGKCRFNIPYRGSHWNVAP